MAVIHNPLSLKQRAAFGVLALVSFGLFAACGSDSSGTGNNADGQNDAATEPGDDEDGGNSTGNKPGDDAGGTPPDPTKGDAAAPMIGDAGAGDAGAGEGDGGTFVNDCEGKKDEAVCGAGGLCFDEVCTPSRCGDGVIDPAIDEECEDDNEVGGDGCTLCRFDCSAAADCDDGNVCNGDETCAAAAHTCQPGTRIAEGSPCKDAAGEAGECSNQVCAPVGCGNSVPNLGEDCDDGNADDADGCTAKCEYTCKADADCDNSDACDGAETCDVVAHTCAAGKPITCAITKGCVGVCEPKVGACVYPDVDADGSSCNVDCKDADPAVFPGGFECKDGKDNDCDDLTADGAAPGCECYVDADSDGFAASIAGAVTTAGACADKFTRTKPTGLADTDCGAATATAFPGQSQYFPTQFCKGPKRCLAPGNSFDYDCNGNEEASPANSVVAAATCAGGSLITCKGRSGWVTKVPACGATGTYRSCTYSRVNGCTGTDSAKQVQSCH